MIIRKICLAALLIAPAAAIASENQQAIIESAPAEISAARIASLHVLRDRPGLRVQVVVQDMGGSTDMSPTLNAYLAIYAKGEICSMDAMFNLGSLYSFQSVRRKEGGVYELLADMPVDSQDLMQKTLLEIDARKAVMDVERAPCAEHETSGLVETHIVVTRRPQ